MRRSILLAVLLGALHLPAAAHASPIGYSVQSNGNDHLYRIDLSSGIATDLGALTFGDAEGLAFRGSTLYAIGGSVDEFWDITAPPGSLVGATGSRAGLDAGLAYDPTTGTMYHTSNGVLYTVNLVSGAVTLVGDGGQYSDGLAIDSGGTAYATSFLFAESLFTVNLATGVHTLVGALGIGDFNSQSGLDFSGSTLYALTSSGNIYTLNTSTGAATFVTGVVDSATGAHLNDWEGLAIQSAAEPVPEPATLLLLGTGLLAAGARRRALMKTRV